MVKALDHRIVESEIELQPQYNVHFRTNTLGKGTIIQAMGEIIPLLFFDKDGFGI